MSEHLHDAGTGRMGFLLSACCAILAWISIKEVQILLACVASLVAIVAGILSARVSWYKGELARKEVKK